MPGTKNSEKNICFPWKNSSKGQLISKCPFGIIVWTKIPIGRMKFFEPSWGLLGSFLGLLVGFLVYDIEY